MQPAGMKKKDELQRAIKAGDLAAVQKIVTDTFDVNMDLGSGCRALHIAAGNNEDDTSVSFLLTKGADIECTVRHVNSIWPFRHSFFLL